MSDETTAPMAPTQPLRAEPEALPAAVHEVPAVAAVAAVELLPTVRDHVARLRLQPWQAAAVVARMNGTHDEDGARTYAAGVDFTTRLADADFDAALAVALHGRI